MRAYTVDRKDGKPIQAAEEIVPYICGRPECGQVHVMLLDEGGEPFAHFCIPNGFVEAVQRLIYEAAAIRGEEGPRH